LKWVTTCLLLTHSLARADYALHTWEPHHADSGEFLGQEEILYYSTNSNFDAAGNLSTVNGLNSYTRIENQFGLNYGLNSRWTIYGNFNWGRVEVDSSLRTGNSFGFTDQILGIHFQFLKNLSLQIEGSAPLYNNAQSDKNQLPHLGSQSIDGSAGLFTSFELTQFPESRLQLTAGSGFTLRNMPFSNAIPWSILLAYDPLDSQGLHLSLAGFGLISVNSSGSSSTSFAGSGGSYFTDTTSPSLTSARIELGYHFSDTFLGSVNFTQSVWGLNSANGSVISFGLAKTFGKSKGEKSRTEMTNEEYGKSNQGLVEYSHTAKVAQVNDRLNLVKINKGRDDGIQVGMLFDIFELKPDGSAGDVVARTKVTAVKLNESALTILEYFKQTNIEEGFQAKRVLQ